MKLLATDMDGTILDADNAIPEESRQLIEELHTRGVLTCFVTGRMWKSPAWFAKQFSYLMPLISCNGAVVHSADGQILSHLPLPADVFTDLVDFCCKDDIYFQCYNLDALYLSGYSRRTLRRYALSGDDYTKMQAPIVIDPDPVQRILDSGDLPVKFVIMDEDETKLQEIRRKVEERPGIHVSKSAAHNLEITREGATKGHALRLLAESMGVQKQDITVIGDNENDIPMFAQAGLSIGVEGGSPLVLDAADRTAKRPEEGGWADAIRRYVLENLA